MSVPGHKVASAAEQAQIDRLVWQVVPEENTRTIALMTDQTQITQYVPYIALEQLKAAPNVNVVQSDSAFWTYFIGFKINHPTVADPAVRRAINIAVDQDALERELRAGRLCAALDVFAGEPLPADHPLWTCPGLLITPHIAGNMTLPWTVRRIVELFLEDLERYDAGLPLLRHVDPRKGY